MPPKSRPSTASPPRAAASTAVRTAKSGAEIISPWEPQQERALLRASKREAVLRVAAQIFNEKGFHATSLDEVAERLNITKPTLYYYVKNKDEILFECVNIGLQMLQDAIGKVALSGGSAIDKLVAGMHRYVEIVTMDFGMCVIRVGEDPLPVESQRKLRRFKAALDKEFRELIRQGIAEGSIAPCDPKIAAFTLAGALSWIGRWYQPGGDLQPDEIARQSIALLINGLGQRPAAVA
ncbi:MAG: TetR/AcrR family transcriptional regulator [Pseudomonadota bacterium]